MEYKRTIKTTTPTNHHHSTSTNDHTHNQSNMNPTTTPSETQYQANNTTQWAHQETVELISIRGHLDKDFSNSKRNKALWETVASCLNNKGFFRTPHQCKSKWKNLVIRYKGKETSEPENGKQCPFFEELHAVFTERAESLQQPLVEGQQVSVQSRKRTKSNNGDQFLEDFSQDEGDEGDDIIRDGLIRESSAQRRKIDSNISSSTSIPEMLRVFFQEQQKIEIEWRESMERHHRERVLFEYEWRQAMENMERERLVMDKAWMEREEQRKMKEEIQAEKRDTLFTSLLNKLISQDNL